MVVTFANREIRHAVMQETNMILPQPLPSEICAAHCAFLKYSQGQQIRLLTVMPLEEAVAILKRCL